MTSLQTQVEKLKKTEIELTNKNEELQESQVYYRSIINNISSGIIIIDAENHQICDINPYAEQLIGLSRELIIGRKCHNFVCPAEEGKCPITDLQEIVDDSERILINAQGNEIPIFKDVTSVIKKGRKYLIESFKDITNLKKNEEHIKYLAYHDGLTGAANRSLFNDRLSLALAQARRLKHMLAVMFVDLDMFKLFNDKMGHARGDQLLKDTVQHLKTLVRETDLVSRIGGDEFAILLTQIEDSLDALKVAERIKEAVNYAWSYEEQIYRVTASIGISIYPKDGEDIDSLLSSADTAMYQTKNSGGHDFLFYSKR